MMFRRPNLIIGLLAIALPLLAACDGKKSPEDTRGADTGVASSEGAPSSKSDRPAAGPDAAKAGAIWQGPSGNPTWTPDDIVATGAGGRRFSMRDLVMKERKLARDSFPETKDLEPCSDEENVIILSVVGDVMSLERSDYYSCPGAAHPEMVTWYQSIDLAHPERTVKLTDFFNEHDILQALLADGVVAKTLAKEEGSPAPPVTLDDLVKRLAGIPAECEYVFDDDLLTRFAFHHVENGKVAVRIGLSNGLGACRGMLTQIGILLPIPPALAGPLDRASTGADGIMMREMKKIAGSRSTSIKVN